jgi:ribosomal protein S18 acetylase RimI-like enzyme
MAGSTRYRRSVGYDVRAARLADADDLGGVHVRAWRAAYRDGLMPDEYLDGLSESERASDWRVALAGPPRSRGARLVAESEDGTVVAFALVGPAGGDPEAELGELYAINVDPAHWGSGVGSELLAAATDALESAGFGSAILWVHPDNERARDFYETRGWSADGVERTQEVMGVVVPEVRYTVSF